MNTPAILRRLPGLRCLLALGAVGCGGSAATAPDPTLDSLAVQPACDRPAPLYGALDPAAPGYIVVFRDGVESDVETPRLAALYGFQPTFRYSAALEGFAAVLTAETVAQLRCVPTVRSIEHDAVTGAAAGAASSPTRSRSGSPTASDR